MKRAVVLLSGGIDSTVTLAVAKSECSEIYAVSFDYGQRNRIELDLAGKSAAHFQVRKHHILSCDLRAIGGSALTGDMDVPKNSEFVADTYERVKTSSSRARSALPDSDIPVTYVPARNTIFLSFGLAVAEREEAENIYIGANAVDYSGYPDCRPEFIRAFERMANLATKVAVQKGIQFRVCAPLLFMTKGEIIQKGRELGVDFSLTWSCYDPQQARNEDQRNEATEKEGSAPGPWSQGSVPLVPCRRCDSCRIREKGFEEAGLDDPLLRKANY